MVKFEFRMMNIVCFIIIVRFIIIALFIIIVRFIQYYPFYKILSVLYNISYFYIFL